MTPSFYRYTNANVMESAYGRSLETNDDKFIRLAVEFEALLNSNDAAGSHPVDIVPICE